MKHLINGLQPGCAVQVMSNVMFGHELTINFILGVSIVFVSMHQVGQIAWGRMGCAWGLENAWGQGGAWAVHGMCMGTGGCVGRGRMGVALEHKEFEGREDV